ncbi:MAG: hypothetical protein NT120_02235 [Candidatus Aenigmarchaeota archaeon]|nr:hypothetical protein [Candidatus Aenigmarchaeota archaeon]
MIEYNSSGKKKITSFLDFVRKNMPHRYQVIGSQEGLQSKSYVSTPAAHNDSPVAEAIAKVEGKDSVFNVSAEEIYNTLTQVKERAKDPGWYRNRTFEAYLRLIGTSLKQTEHNDAYFTFLIPMRTAAKTIAARLTKSVSAEKFFNLHEAEITKIIENADGLKDFLNSYKTS